ncbi:hypothetical protein ACF1GY_06565 [Streptomyces sp. NPDC014684]|uniref:hypothetical protein n=1 Tax=unclassified Streptomyces TaxID=2593676 RepID=UPI00370173A5
MSDEELKAQAMLDPAHTRNLIAIEKARSAWKMHLLYVTAVVIVSGFGIAAWTATSLHAAGHLHLPWPKIATVLGTFLGTALVSVVTAVTTRRRVKRRRAAATPANQAQTGAQGDPDQVGTP